MERKPIYRFKVFDATLQSKMRDFAELHAFESRVLLKENYEKWLQEEDVKRLIQMEHDTLLYHGYQFGDTVIEKKLFTSIKYYHIKNLLQGLRPCCDEVVNVKKWKNEVHFSKPFIDCVKDHLLVKKEASCKPADSFVKFVEEHEQECDHEQEHLKLTDDKELFYKKLKKMYKNQYYQVSV